MNILHPCGGRAAKRFAGVALALTTAAAMLAAPAAHAATTTNIACHDTAGLIAAMSAAAPGDVINLAKHCTYTLTDTFPTGGTPNTLQVGLPPVSVASPGLTINGNGSTITRSKTTGTPDFAILENDFPGVLTVSDLTLSGGVVDIAGGGSCGAFASGLLNGGDFTGHNLRVTKNLARATDMTDNCTAGGGVENEGTMTLDRHSSVDHNQAVAVCTSLSQCTAVVEGGGIATDGALAVEDSTVRDNTAKVYGNFEAVAAGAGIAVDAFTSSDTILDHDKIGHNTVSSFSSGSSSLAGGGGGAFFGGDQTPSSVTVTSTTVSGNSAKANGAAIDIAIGGGFLNGAGGVNTDNFSFGEGTVLTGTADTFTGNASVSVDTPGGAALGGGLSDAEGPLGTGSSTFTATTFSKNRAKAQEGVGQGGGIASVLDGNVTLYGGSVTKNVASGGTAEGGGIFVDETSTVSLNGTNVAKNKPDNCFPHNTITGCLG